MLPHIIGEHPMARSADGKLKSRIATVFPFGNTIVTLPGIHATQRMAYVDALTRQRSEQGLGPLSREEEAREWQNSVDLIIEDDIILIRPDPQEMSLSFRADDLLQEFVPKHRVRFLLVRNQQVRTAIKERGELWRVSPLPKTADEMNRMIGVSRIGIRGNELYYYSKATGTRLLTYEAFSELKGLDDASLRQHLAEIREFSAGVNRYGNPEIGFFMAGEGFSKADFAPYDFAAHRRRDAAKRLRSPAAEVRRRGAAGVPSRRASPTWNGGTAMYAALIGEDEKTVSEESLLGLSSEFFMQIEWLPGGRIEEGELIFDSVLRSGRRDRRSRIAAAVRREVPRVHLQFRPRVRRPGIRQHRPRGRVALAPGTTFSGRRDVYIAQVKQRGITEEIVKIIRMQKWGIREHLDDGKKLLDAIIQSEEYTEYILDRRLGCRQLGMNLPARTAAKRISERYAGLGRDLCNAAIWLGANMRKAPGSPPWWLWSKTLRRRLWLPPWPMPRELAPRGPGSSKPPSGRRRKPTCSGSRRCSAAGFPSWSRPVSTPWWKRATPLKSPISSVSTN